MIIYINLSLCYFHSKSDHNSKSIRNINDCSTSYFFHKMTFTFELSNGSLNR